MKKYRKDGKTAVLVSPGHGAGWSTWEAPPKDKFLALDRGLIELKLAGASWKEAAEYLQDEDIYLGGWDQAEIQWVPIGERFIIKEYNGYESLVLLKDVETWEA